MSSPPTPARGAARALDVAAIGLSGLCLAHCLALPVAAAFLPLLGAWSEAEWVHLAFLAAAIPVSVTALVRSGGWRKAPVASLAIAGLGFLTVGALGWPTEAWETGLTVLGGLMLATAHLLNWRLHHRHG